MFPEDERLVDQENLRYKYVLNTYLTSVTPQYALSTYCMSLRPFHSWLRLLPPHILYITYSIHCLYTDSLVVNTHLNYSHTQSSSAIVLAVPQYIY